MKALFTIPILSAIVLAGLVSFSLFQQEAYGSSALMTLTSVISMAVLVILLKSKKTAEF